MLLVPHFAHLDLENRRKQHYAFYRHISHEPEVLLSTTVTSRGRITIPKEVRELLEIGPGSEIQFVPVGDGRIALIKVGDSGRPSRFARLLGQAGKGLSTDEIMAMSRGERTEPESDC